MYYKLYLSLVFTLCVLPVVSQAQHFYDIETVQNIELTFEQSNWDALMDAQKAGDGNYIMAASITINGTILDSVGVKYKGNSSYNASQVKNPLHIELDTYKDQDYQGYTDIKLSNGFKDPSFVREVLSYSIIRKYMDAPLSNYANVTINGSLVGLFSNSESISKKFVDSRFGSKSNTFIKCNPIDGAGPQSTDLPSLEYKGLDSSAYEAAYELKSDTGWDDLIELCNVLSNNSQDIDQVLDIDRAIWMIALDNVLVNLDSYIGRFQQNYYLYQDDFDRFIPVIWDLNESFGVFSQTGTINLNNTTAKQQMTHLLHATDATFPLVKSLLENPLYRRMYLAHIKTILLENFENGDYFSIASEYQSIIDEDFKADPNAFFTYENFIDNLETDFNLGGGPMGGTVPGLSNLMEGRNSYLLDQSDFTALQPSISNIQLTDESPEINDVITITASIANSTAVYIGTRTEANGPFTRTLMYDDGAHGDGAVNDGLYGVELVIEGLSTDFYIFADGETIGAFSPARAEYEYHQVKVGSTTDGLVINEFLASNDGIRADQDGEYDDWIELYNNSSQAIDISGYYISDDVTELTQWSFPDNTVIEANDYLIIWADNDTNQEGLHANFKLSANGESIYLSDNNGQLVNQVNFTNQLADISYGRYPNGIGDFTQMVPTFNSENMVITSTYDYNYNFEVRVFPIPTDGTLQVESDQLIVSSRVFSSNGQLVRSQVINSQGLSLDLASLTQGLYILQCTNNEGYSTFTRIAVY